MNVEKLITIFSIRIRGLFFLKIIVNFFYTNIQSKKIIMKYFILYSKNFTYENK